MLKLNRWPLTLGWLSGVVGIVALWDCGGMQSAGEDAALEYVEHVEQPVVKKEQDRFVMVLSTARLYRAADESAEFLQLRSVEEEAAEREAHKEVEKKRAERDAKNDKAWNAAEKKRVTRARKRARGKKKRAAVNAASRERRDARRDKRVARAVDYARKDADKYIYLDPGKRVVVLKWVADHGDWVEVETVSGLEAEQHCHGQGHAELGQLRMRFFVERDALLETTRDTTVIEMTSRTSVELLPGVALIPVSGKKPRYRALVDGFEITVSGEGYRVGEAYRPVKRFEMQTTDTVFSNDALIHKRLRFHRYAHLPFNPYYMLYVLETGQAGQTVYATTQTPCARYVVRVRGADLVQAPGNAMRFDLHKTLDPPVRPYVEAGAEVFSPQGVLLGEAYLDAHLGAPIRELQNIKDGGGRGVETMCFRKAFSVQGKRGEEREGQGLDLCVKADDVVRQELKVF